MPLTPNQRIAHYRIERKIGEGGMGEVWAATDTRLNRPAAIKALPAAVADEPERLARFNREAQLLAALNHPNIAAIYGLEKVDDVPYLALELVEGQDLSERIERGGALALDEALEIALQIALALEAAHDKGIVHRDLKPANIKLGADGKVKVLDFGLAKALSTDPEQGNSTGGSLGLARSPTMTAALGTQAGMILGTAAYMAPEQARGKAVDRRADIWAFGLMLYEMLVGEQLFTGETATDIIAAVVTREPDWSKLPAGTPAGVRRVLKRCLQKDPRKRLRDIGDAVLELEDRNGDEAQAAPAAVAEMPARASRTWLFGVAGILLGLIGAFAIRSVMAPEAVTPAPTWSSLSPPAAEVDYDFTRFIEISPDGRRVAFGAPGPDGGEPLLWVRELGSEQSRPLVGTEGARQPFWSPDSRSIGYFAKRKLRRVGIDGGAPKTLADAGGQPRGGCWGDDGTILFVPDWSKPVFRVPAAGGTPQAVTQFNEERLELSHRWPHLLPDGRHFLFFIVSTYPELNPDNPAEADQSGLYLGSLDGAEEPRLLHKVYSRAAYTDKTLVFVDDGILMARPFDLGSLSFSGESVALAEKVTQSVDALWGGALFSVSDEGTLLFVRGAPERRSISQLTWRDRKGEELGTIGRPRAFTSVRLSHDGRRLATSVGDPGDVWIYDLERDSSTRFTFDPGHDTLPIWSPDDRRVLFQSARVVQDQSFTPANLFVKATSGLEAEVHLAAMKSGATTTLLPADWTPDGSAVVLTALRTGTGSDIVLYSLDDQTIEPLLEADYDEQTARLSRDGRWLAYESNESGDYEIYVQAFPGGGKWQVSSAGGMMPVWRADGKELYYASDEGLMAVSVETGGGFRHDAPVKLFDFDASLTQEVFYNYDAMPDGQRFLLLAPPEQAPVEKGSVTLVQGWRSLLE